jgi:hypothetical protein
MIGGVAGMLRAAAFAATRIRPRFTDGFGNHAPPDGSDAAATGFWVVTGSEPPDFILVTNKHVVDQRLSSPGTSRRLSSVEVELRRVSADAELDVPRETRFFRVANLDACLFVAETADCAIFCNPMWEGDASDFAHTTAVSENILGTTDAFEQERGELEFCDPVAFIGFPSTRESKWWDQKWKLPIAREASIASLPDHPFENEGIRTSDVVLLSGLSFGGSSGSPVFTHRKHVVTNAQMFDPWMGSVAVREPVLVGIMSGHFDVPNELPEMFRHSGLSYMTRSTAIVEMIGRARSLAFRNTRPFDGLDSVRMAPANDDSER